MHTVNKALLLQAFRMYPVFTMYCVPPLQLRAFIVLPRQGENVKSTLRLSNLKCALKVIQKQQEIHFVKCRHPCKLFCSVLIAVRWTRLYYFMRCLRPYELFCGAFSSIRRKTRLQSSVLLYFCLLSKGSLIIIWKQVRGHGIYENHSYSSTNEIYKNMNSNIRSSH